MNEVMKALLKRRRIRKYKPDMVETDLIDEVIQAGLYAAALDMRPIPCLSSGKEGGQSRLLKIES